MAHAQTDVKLRLFSPGWRGIGDQTQQEAAKRFPIIYGREDPTGFHQGNPDVKYIRYTLGPYINQDLLKVLPLEAIAHDKDGGVVKVRDWPNWMIVPDNPKWLEYQKKMVADLMSSGYDGLYVDSLGSAPIETGYVLTKAINPATGKPYTKQEWLAAEIKMVEATKQALPKGKLIVMNGLSNGTRYWAEPEAGSPRVFLPYFDGGFAESIWRAAWTPLNEWPTPEKWMLDIRMVQDVDRRGLYGFWWTKGASVGGVPKDEGTSQGLIPQWRRFALASYLLAAGPKSYFNFTANDKERGHAAEYYPEYDAPLGTATGSMQQIGETGVYWRPFSGGFVMVNPGAKTVEDLRPTGTENAEFTAAGEDRKLRAPFTIAAHTGLILTGEQQSETKFRLFTPAWRNIGEQKPQDVAKKFTIIFGNLDPKPFHEGNPDAKCIKYTLGPYVVKSELKTLPEEAVAHDQSGQVPKAREFANWLIVPDNPKWLAFQQNLVRKVMNSDFDGLFVDSMGTAPVDSKYLFSSPANPHTGKPYTKQEWLAAEVKMMQATVEALPKGKLIFMNGLGPGSRYWTEPEDASPRVLLAYVNGAMSESIWRAAKSPIDAWPTPESWMLDIRMVQDVERRGLTGFWWTKCWCDGNTCANEPGAETLVPQWRRFAMGSYLLAAGPHSYFNFDTVKNDKPSSNAAEYFPEYDTPLGHATGAMQEFAGTGVYWRPFSGGLVIVNPGAKVVEGLRPPGFENAEFTSAGENRKLRAPFSVSAHTGLILTAGR
jgi:hypothetical protein